MSFLKINYFTHTHTHKYILYIHNIYMKRERNVVHLFCETHNSIHSNDDYDQMKTFGIVALFLFLCNKFECCGINLNDMEKMRVLRLTLVETHLEMFPKSTTMLEFEEEKKNSVWVNEISHRCMVGLNYI